MSDYCKCCMGDAEYHLDTCPYYPKKPTRPAHKPTERSSMQITNATTMQAVAELVPAYSDLMQRVINKLSAARNYTELLESPETEAQAQKYRANALKGIDEAVQLIRCGK